ncbi:hypothetical protein QLQ12_29060 [Actinoplanes sp. NEAU-A12]|uniref:Lipoprotein n=2 Tax=Actinoplanes sandaracinus TaxID=3045177 RepID=A0ABT6WSF9_9ACTN|nr:hypothetical protein [Actinoplanes sandaracinus]
MAAGLLAAVLLSASQVACGTTTAKASTDVATTAARLDELQIQITGKVEELRAAELLNYHRVEGGIGECMREAGRKYVPVPYVSFYEGFTDADLGYGNGRATVVDSMTTKGRRIVLNELASARLKRAGAVDRKVIETDVEVLNGCAARFESRGYHDFDPPAGVRELSGLEDLLEPIHQDPAVVTAMGGYAACMKKRYGFKVDDRSDFLFKPRIAAKDAPLPGQPAKPAWTKGVAAIDKVFTADAECRRPAYEAAMTLLADRIEPWRKKNRDRLFAVRAGWRKAVGDAKKIQE